uniref:cysteine--tRNA ligase n=1 Tax=Lygus hesperus TaxID=30085 RepID=A0A0A9WHK9_LYGHE
MLNSYLRRSLGQIRRVSDLSSKKWKLPAGHPTNVDVFNRLADDTVNLVTNFPNSCNWYCCGPTVYDSPHLGHACCYMQFDLIRRILEDVHGINVIMLMSITDIDDKIINEANKRASHFQEVALQYEQEFFDSMSKVNIKPPSLSLRVSQHIEDIIQFISKIINNGHGYVADDRSVYFSVDNFPRYGKLSPAQEPETAAGKQSNRDFALWKAAKPGEPYWDSPWGRGRPGWHIECSAMASKYFGSSVDIHTGGIDLLFPHHENEEAQSCAYHGCDQWVNYWLHSGHLHLQGQEKMSKSLKNTVSISTFLEEYSPDHLRTLCMLVPYRNGIEYSRDVMTNATSVYSKLNNFLSDCDAFIRGVGPKPIVNDGILLKELQRAQENIRNCLSSDFNTNGAMTDLLNLMSRTTSELNSRSEGLQNTSFSVIAIANYVKNLLGKLGFFANRQIADQSTQVDDILQASLNLRTSVRGLALSNSMPSESREVKKSLLTACDVFRSDLKNLGIEIKDRANASTWTFSTSRKQG